MTEGTHLYADRAPHDETFLVLSASDNIINERVFTPGTALAGTDGGAGSAYTLNHLTTSGYVHIPTNGAAAQLLQYTSAGTAKWISVSGDATIADGGAVTIDHGGLDGLTDDDHTQYLKEQPATDDVWNESGGDYDLRMEGDTATNLLKLDAGLDAVQIGTTVAGAIADFRATGTVFNEAGADADIRFEGDTNVNLLYLDAGNDRVGIRGVPTDGTLHVLTASAGTVAASTSADELVLENDTYCGLSILAPSDSISSIFFGSPSGSTAGQIQYFHAAHPSAPNEWQLSASNIALLKLSTAAVVVNDDSYDVDFRVESNANANAIFVDAGNNRVGIMNGAPGVALDVTGAITCSGDLLVDGANIGITADADLITMTADTLTVAGTIAATTVTGANVTTGANPGHTHTGASLGSIDISDDTNLSATSGIVLTGDQLTHDTADPYKHVPTGGASTQLLQYSAAGTAKWVTVSGDALIADGGAVTIDHGGLDGLTDDDHTQYVLRQPTADIVINDSGGDFDVRFEGDTDANLLYLDAGNNRVGIRTPTPGTALDVNGGGTFSDDIIEANAGDYQEIFLTKTDAVSTLKSMGFSKRNDTYFGNTAHALTMLGIYVDAGGNVDHYIVPLMFQPNGDVILAGASNATNGKVGIGTTGPTSLLEVYKSTGASLIKVTSVDNYAGYAIYRGTTESAGLGVAYSADQFATGVAANDLVLAQDITTAKLHLATGVGPVTRLTVDSTGNVGIGTRGPNQLLTVEGSISMKEQAAAAADTAAYGQLWVKNTTPCQLWFTDDAGNDTQIV